MKLLCRTNNIDDFCPAPFDLHAVDKIVETVQEEILNKYGKRFKDIQVDIDDIVYDDYDIKFKVYVFNGDKLKLQGEFVFTPYSDYWDVTDYEQHKNTTISRFVNDLAESTGITAAEQRKELMYTKYDLPSRYWEPGSEEIEYEGWEDPNEEELEFVEWDDLPFN